MYKEFSPEVGIPFSQFNSLKALHTAARLRKYRPFEEARKFVHTLGLRSGTEWQEYRRSGKRPPDIPSNPAQV